MKKNYALIFIICLCFFMSGYGQILTFEFNGLTGSEATATSNFNDANLSNSTISRGAGLNATNNANRFNANNWALNDIATAISGNNYMEFTITPNATYEFDVTTININFQRSATGTSGILLRSSLDGYTSDIDTEKVIADNTSVQTFSFNVGQTSNTSAVTYRIYGWAEATGGTGGFEGTGNDIIVNGSVNSSCSDAVDFENISSPTTSPETITEGNTFNVSTQAVEPGITDANPLAEGVGVEAWIGYSSTDNDPSTSAGWTWISATYTNDIGANDIHQAEIGSGLAPGTYYYATRHRLNGCGFTYGGSGGFWNNDSQVLIVNALPPADVVITEVMYNTTGTDDEWIEICNVSGSSQSLNNYTIEVGNTTVFTFPSSGVILADGDCITIALGDSGDATFNPDCPFTPDYTNGLGTGTLNNTSDIIELIGSDGSTVIDGVTYNSSDGGNTVSFHVVDTSLDNSVTSSNYWEVIDGGSPGINSLISPCTPVGPEINLEGTTANFPDIANGDTTPASFDGTDFGSVTIGGTSTNTFRIENFGGTQNLTITNVAVSSGDIGDFSISSSPSSSIAALDFSLFDIEFSPTATGARTVEIEIRSNDSDEDPYTFTVTGNGLCAASAITAEPSSGPEGTVVTVTGTNLSSATASFNGLAATVNNISATSMEVTVPSGASTGNLEITDDLGCPGTTPFTVIESEISTCQGSSGTTPTDLFISEVTDANTGGLTYIEIYNGTGSTVNLSGYSIQFFNNGNATENGGLVNLNNINLATSDTYVVSVSTGSTCSGITGADGSLADQTGFGGVNFSVNSDDHVRLYDGTTHIDSWGEYLSNTWADALGIGSEGVVFTRNNNAGSLPNTTFNIADWTYVDWTACADNDYSNIGTYDFSTGTPPTVSSIVSNTTSCNEITITVTANEGTVGGNTLGYYWYAFDPSNAGLEWQQISNGGIYTTTTNSPSLIISDATSVSDFQFYCQVREDDATCYTASNAISITISQATWDGTNWVWNDGTAIDTLPTISTNIILAANFSTANTGLQQSFSGCNLTINDNVTLTINDDHYVEIENNLTVNNTTTGGINIEPRGSFVQINDSGSVSANTPTNLTVSKLTASSNNWFEYTYWSSPVFEETPAVGLAASNPNRRFQYNAQYYRDSTFENNNDDTTSTGAGVDDVDDQAPYDWGNISTTYLVPGVGYASTHDPISFASTPGCPGPTCRIRYTFSGLFNTGVVTVPLYRNDSETDDNNWNLVGNPYPSAIDADVFLNTNMGVIDVVSTEPAPIIEGAIYLWSQNTAPADNTNGNQSLNFSQSDYAIINGTGQTAAQSDGGDSIVPTRHIPSGQAFFIVMDNTATSTQVSPSPVPGDDIQTADIIFNNAMRVTGNNDQFFRNTLPSNKLWLNLETDNGAFSQILIGYLDNASDTYDGMYYDAPRNGSIEANTTIYTTIPGMNKGFAIQGKNSGTLSIDEVIPVGFNTSINEPTIYTLSIAQVEGEFMNSNDVFVIDRLLNSIHNLKISDYSFTSEVGTFNERFEIVFNANALSIDDNSFDPNELTITELSEKEVQIKVGSNHTITKVEILDILGRTIYTLNGSSSTEVYDISKLSKAAYIAKVTLATGQTVNKKAIKRL